MRFDFVEFIDLDGRRYGLANIWCASCTSIAEFVSRWENKNSCHIVKAVGYKGEEYYV